MMDLPATEDKMADQPVGSTTEKPTVKAVDLAKNSSLPNDKVSSNEPDDDLDALLDGKLTF